MVNDNPDTYVKPSRYMSCIGTKIYNEILRVNHDTKREMSINVIVEVVSALYTKVEYEVTYKRYSDDDYVLMTEKFENYGDAADLVFSRERT